MLEDKLAAEDNFNLKMFRKNEVYDVRQSVGCDLVAKGKAEALSETTPVQAALEKIRRRFYD